jgi:hypothetical protein
MIKKTFLFFILVFIFFISKIYAEEFAILLDNEFNDSLVYYVYNRSEYNILINCSVHGDEDLPYKIISEFLDKGYFENQFSYANYIVVLKPSSYRLKNKSRYSLERIDPNRTYISLFSKSSKLILKLLSDYDIDLILDLHEAGNRENIDFMYSNGFYSKFLLNFLKNYNIIYNKDNLNKLIEIERNIESTQLKIFEQVYKNSNIMVSKYSVNNYVSGYNYASILRNYGVIRHIPTILFEIVNKENKDYIANQVYYYFFENLKNYLFLFKEYKSFISEMESNFTIYYLFDKNYDNIDVLLRYLNLNKIKYYYFFKFKNLNKAKLMEYNIKKTNLKTDKIGMKGLLYCDFEIYQTEITDKSLISNYLDNSIIIPFGLLCYYLLDPNSGESLFNFNILPLNYYKLRELPVRILIIYK